MRRIVLLSILTCCLALTASAQAQSISSPMHPAHPTNPIHQQGLGQPQAQRADADADSSPWMPVLIIAAVVLVGVPLVVVVCRD